MSKKHIAILWGIQIGLYIINIILAFIKGPTLETCILGWLLAILLVVLIIFLQFKLEDANRTNEQLRKDNINLNSRLMNLSEEFKKEMKENKKLNDRIKRQNQAQDGEDKQGR